LENPYRALSKINPQKEGHHREIANDVFDALIGARLSGGEYQVVMSIIERTWGHPLQAMSQSHSRVISLAHFQKTTNLSRQGVIDAVGNLEKKRVIAAERSGTKGTEYLFNKHYDTWLVNHTLLVGGVPLVNQALPGWSSRVDQTSQVELTSTSQVVEPSTQPPIEIIETIETIERGESSPAKDTSPKKEIPKKRHYFFDNILLFEDEYKKLVEKFGEAGTKDRLEGLSLYKKSKGKRYASDYATVLTWDRRDKQKGERTGIRKGSAGVLKGVEIEE